MPENMAAGVRRINNRTLFTNRKLPSIHSESATRSRSKPSTYSHAEEKGFHLGQPMQADSGGNFWVCIYQPFSSLQEHSVSIFSGIL